MTMRRRGFLLVLAGGVILRPIVGRAQQAKRKPKLGVLIGFAEDDPRTKRSVAAFLKGLADLGWVLDRDLTIDFRYGAADADRNRSLAKEPRCDFGQLYIGYGRRAARDGHDPCSLC